MKNKLETLIAEAIRELFGVSELSFTVEHPELVHGDYTTNAALIVAKQAGKNPKDVATALAEHLIVQQIEGIDLIAVAGPGFLNFSLSRSFVEQSITDILSHSTSFGTTDQFRGQVWGVEYASPNPNKAMHLGHLRNVLTGIAVCNLLEANGATVIREMVDNNRGIAIAKLMWGYLVGARKDGKRVEDVWYWNDHQGEWLTPEEANKTPDQFIDEWYVLGAKECEESPAAEATVRDMVVRWEQGDALIRKLWEKVLAYSYEGQARTMRRLGARFDCVWHEHEHYEKGKEYVMLGLEKGVFIRLEDGAVLTNLSSYNIPDTILIKRDGTSLYITQDIALTALKKQSSHTDHLMWIIGPEQSLAMRQLFAVCEQLDIGALSEFEHLSYGYMSIKGQGKMSSRKGNVVYIDTVLDEAKAVVTELIQERIPSEQQDVIAEQVAHGAVTYSILRAGRMTETAFDFDSALEMEGDTGPYLQYSVVRAASVLQKGAHIEQDNSAENAQEVLPISDLERMLYRLPEVVARAGREHEPSTLVTYLTNLATSFNSFYAQHQIIDENDLGTTNYRVRLSKAFIQVMTNGLSLLGIQVPEKM